MIGGLHGAVRNGYAKAGQLFELHLDLLYQCDLDCTHCYLDHKSPKLRDTAFWKRILDEAAEMQVFMVTLSGGEIFLRKDALELIEHARGLGLFVHLKTHAGHIDAAVAQRLAALGVSTVSVSYYAADPVIHDKITQRPGSHEATLAALVAMKAAGLHVIVACSVLQESQHAYGALVEQCKALGIMVRLEGHLRPTQQAGGAPSAKGLDLEGMIELESFRAEGSGSACSVPSASNDWGDKQNCVAGVLALYVTPDGLVTPCVTWPEAVADLTTGVHLKDVWSTSQRLAEIRKLRRRDREGCGDCSLRGGCDYCMGQAWLQNRDPNVPTEGLCATAHAKATAVARSLGLSDPQAPRAAVATRSSKAPSLFRILPTRPAP